MTIAEALAARVEELLKKHNMTQYRLFKLSGVSQSSIGDIRHMRNKTEMLNSYMRYRKASGWNCLNFSTVLSFAI